MLLRASVSQSVSHQVKHSLPELLQKLIHCDRHLLLIFSGKFYCHILVSSIIMGIIDYIA